MTLNDIIEQHLGLWWTEKSKAAAQQHCSAEQFLQIEQICQFAIQHDVWRQGSYSTACVKISDEILAAFPHLSQNAVTRIAKMAAFQHREA